jgi:hypothetical protein
MDYAFTRRTFGGTEPMARGNRSSDLLHSEYLLLSIIPTASRQKRSAASVFTVGALIALSAALIFVYSR